MNTLCLNLTQVNCLNCPPHLLRYPSEEQCHIKLAVKADMWDSLDRIPAVKATGSKQNLVEKDRRWNQSYALWSNLDEFNFDELFALRICVRVAKLHLCCQFLFFLCQNSCLWLANLKAEKNTQTHTHTQTKKKLYLWGFTRCKSLTDKSSSAFRHVEIF